MQFQPAQPYEIEAAARLDGHIPRVRLVESIAQGRVYLWKDDTGVVRGLLRYSLFWQTIPFLDLIYLEEGYRRRGIGREMMAFWEAEMRAQGYASVMTSTQADEEAWKFYEALGYRKVGGFFPPEQEAEEWIYLKNF